jgi:glucan phosphoethanolaminetransferase (alkaline phosphatase superfamily)
MKIVHQVFNWGRKTHIGIIILSIIVLLPNIYLVFYGSDFNSSPVLKRIFYIGVSFLLFILPFFFLKTKTFFLVQGFFVLLAPLEIAHIYLNKMTITSAFLLSIVDTNYNESTEVLAAIKIPIFGLLAFWLFYFYLTIWKMKNRYFIRSVKIRWIALGVFAALVFTGCSFHFIGNVYPYDFVVRSHQVYTIKKKIKEGRNQLQDFRFNARKANPLQEKEVYVFVIGETGRYSSYSLNGYEKETSPLLSRIDNLVSYSDFLSEANITSTSLQLILTRAFAGDYEKSFVEKSFVDAFKEAGFKTYWIANQSAGNSFVRRISKETDGEFFTTADFDTTTDFDEILWDTFDKISAGNDEKILIVLHSMGSHFRYNFRYPPQYEVFKPGLHGAFDYALISAKNKQLFVNTYDNSILYTDFFLANTIRKIDSLNCVSSFIYVADHGENLFDTDENLVFHGGSAHTKYDFHVPFFVWTSEEYKLQYPSKVKNLNRNKDKKLSAGNIFYSIPDIADITFPEQIRTKSIVSDSLREDSVRYFINTNMELKEGF